MRLLKKPPLRSGAGFWYWELRCGCWRFLWGCAGAGAALGCISHLGCPTWVRAALPSCLGSPGSCGEAFGFLKAACARKHRAKLQGRCGEPSCALCQRGLKQPPSPGCQGTGSTHSPMCSREVRAASKSIPHLPAFISLCGFLVCHATLSRVVMPGEELGAESSVLSCASPAGSFCRPPCLPLAPESAPVSAGCSKEAIRQQHAPAAPCTTGEIPGQAVQ